MSSRRMSSRGRDGFSSRTRATSMRRRGKAAPRRGPSDEPAALCRLLPEGRPQGGMEPAGKEAGGEGARRWIRKASSSGIAMLKTMAKTLSAYKSGILAYYDFPISTGPSGGYQQQDQDDEAPGIRVPGHGVLQAEDHGPS